jgi:hypothetical protein
MSIAARRSLWPREHGAYAQLAAPLAAALAVRTPTVGGGLLAFAAALAFLANEPLLVALGHRGARRREEDGPRARRRLVLLASGAVAAGGAGLALAPRPTLAVAAIVAVPAALVIALAWRRAEHSLVGELAAAIALTGAAAPVGVAAGLSLCTALALWAAWAGGYACTVIAVHRVIARHKVVATARDRWIVALLAVATVGAAALALTEQRAASVAIPLAAIACSLAVRPPAATRLRAIGVALVGVSLVAAVLAVFAAG